MFVYFDFSLPRAVTEQLIERIDELKSSSLTDPSLKRLASFQAKNKTKQGVYVIYLDGAAVYAGKADGLAERLGEHLWKLRGRKGIDLAAVGYKALLLNENWSTSANEDLLIGHFKGKGECRWNGGGFGPKDPGKNRDGSEPSWFDDKFPVHEKFPLVDIYDKTSVGSVLSQIKEQVPYLFRYEVPDKLKAMPLVLTGTPREVNAVALLAAKALGKGWQLMLFKNGFTLYEASRKYQHGLQLLP
jgi:hypothetical protein